MNWDASAIALSGCRYFHSVSSVSEGRYCFRLLLEWICALTLIDRVVSSCYFIEAHLVNSKLNRMT